jgi:outer membrane beta-barrel protein
MHQRQLAFTILAAAAALAPWAARAAEPAPAGQPANEQVVVPQVERREVKLPRFPSNDIEIGVFAGTYATQNFGSSVVAGLRLGYHITEDIFVEGAYGRSRVSDEAFQQILPAPIFGKTSLTYYNLSAGYNVLPGEVFIGSKRAKASALYIIGGVGSTNFNRQRHQTFNVGMGVRVLFTDRFALQVDMRDHIFSSDILGKNQTTQNLEFTGGITFFF